MRSTDGPRPAGCCGLWCVFAATPNIDRINLSKVPSNPAAQPNRRAFKWFGYVLILLALLIFGGMLRWLNTRDYSPFRATVSLKPGHTRTPDFVLNFHADYLLHIAHDNGKCNGGAL